MCCTLCLGCFSKKKKKKKKFVVVIDPFVTPHHNCLYQKYRFIPPSLTTAPAVMISGGNGAGYSTTTIYASSVSSSVTNIPPYDTAIFHFPWSRNRSPES
ncbi:hypothetical protein HanIR_Chr16g0790341 [Helianthus annuus]|nr:hypothetical protein HanIR_Chr16g0790341 [Helianthus annuus]